MIHFIPSLFTSVNFPIMLRFHVFLVTHLPSFNMAKIVCSVSLIGILLKNSQDMNGKSSFETKKNELKNTDLEQTQKRILNACLPAIIMKRMDETTITGPKDISRLLKEHYGVMISPGTLYNAFSKLESQGEIERLKVKTHRLYATSLRGKKSTQKIVISTKNLLKDLER